MKLKILTLTLMIACIGIFAGCRKNVSANPAVIQAVALQDAENSCKAVEDGIKAANDAVERLEAGEPDYYAHIKPILRKLSAANNVAAQKINLAASGQNTGWQAALVSVGTSVTSSDLTAFGFKNQNTQLIVETSFAGLIAALTAIQAKFGGSR